MIFGSTGRDDSYISFSAVSAAQKFGLFHNVNGDLVEQSTSLGFVMLLRGIAALIPLPMPIIGFFVSYIAYFLFVISTYFF